MKHKKTFSTFLICLTLLTSMQFVSYFGDGANVHTCVSETQFIADSQETSQEFLESHELGISDEDRPETGHAIQRHPTLSLSPVANQQYGSFQRDCLFRTPSKRLFISFGALII